MAINEGLINKYRAAYALKPIGSVGNPDEVKEIGFESEANSGDAASRYQYEGEIVGSIEGGDSHGTDEPQIITSFGAKITRRFISDSEK